MVSPVSPEKVRRSGVVSGLYNESVVPSSEETEGLIRRKIKERSAWKVKTEAFLDHWAVTTFMTLITIYALFGDDVRLVAFQKVSFSLLLL